jgi:phosphate transport system substrate-binding protein
LRVAVLSNKLSVKDSLFFVHNKKTTPKQTAFAIDGIALIANKQTNDTIIDLQTVIDFMQGKQNTTLKGLVFDNPNSSTVRYMLEKSGLNDIPKTGVYSFKTNEEVIKHVSENPGMIGFVGVNWLSTPTAAVEKLKQNINILSVKDIGGKAYFYPTQENMGRKKYPLARNLYIINCQGYSGLGMGFASFVAGERGQRIVLKSGLAPAIQPTMNINIRKSINNDK